MLSATQHAVLPPIFYNCTCKAHLFITAFGHLDTPADWVAAAPARDRGGGGAGAVAALELVGKFRCHDDRTDTECEWVHTSLPFDG